MKADQMLTEFWCSLPKLSRSNDILTFTNIPEFFPDKLKSIYIRQSYQDLFSMILTLEKEELHRMAITGNPGIGKSVFLFYILWRLSLIDTTQTVLLHRAKDRGLIYVFQKSGCWSTRNLGNIDSYLALYSTWYLTDTLDPPPGEVKAVTILVSSPATKHFNEFLKYSSTDILRYLPVWTLEELHATSILFDMNQDQVSERFALIGGLIRFVLEKNKHDLEKLINEAMNKTNFGKLKYINLEEKDKINEFSHRVIHFIVDPDTFEKQGLQFSSEFVMDEALERLGLTTLKKQSEFLLQTESVGVLGSYRGHVFEAMAHNVLSAGGTFRIRPLDGGKVVDLELSKRKQQTFKKFDNVIGDDYFRPTSKSFACIDSLILSWAFFQMTISDSHPIKMQKMTDIVNNFGLMPLYFVVPSSIFDSFTMQNLCTSSGKIAQKIPNELKNLKQCVLSIDIELSKGEKRKREVL
jgi:hypothetical protein